jgi:hypothetical protein
MQPGPIMPWAMIGPQRHEARWITARRPAVMAAIGPQGHCHLADAEKGIMCAWEAG